MNELMTDVLAIIEHATKSNELPEGISATNAEYLADVVRLGIESREEVAV